MEGSLNREEGRIVLVSIYTKGIHGEFLLLIHYPGYRTWTYQHHIGDYLKLN